MMKAARMLWPLKLAGLGNLADIALHDPIRAVWRHWSLGDAVSERHTGPALISAAACTASTERSR
jgi:hypothetical protein